MDLVTYPDNIIFDTLRRSAELTASSQQALQRYYHNFIMASQHEQSSQNYYINTSRIRYLDIVDYLAKHPNSRVLDIGSGCGTEAITFARYAASVTGIDVTSNRVNCSQERLERLYPELKDKLSFQYINLLDFEPEQPFDVIWMNQAYHHLEPRAEVNAHLAKLLKKGGKLFISEPNALNILMQLYVFKVRGFKSISSYIDEKGVTRSYGDERILSVSRLRKNLGAQGFTMDSARYYQILPPRLLKMKGLEQLLSRLKLPSPFYINYSASFTKT